MACKTFICRLILEQNNMLYEKNYMSFKLFQYYQMSFNVKRHINTRAISR